MSIRPGGGSASGVSDADLSAAVAALVNSAPGALDTLGELATALQADETAAAALTTAVGKRLIAVDHGSTAGTARPTSTLPVKWFGTVAPSNAVTNDEWYDRTNELLKRYNGTTWQPAGSGTYSPISSAKVVITRNADGTVNTVTETDTGAVTTYTYNADGTPATESRVLSGVTTTRTFGYTNGDLTSVS